MKTVEFSEEELLNLNEIGHKLFADEEDPRSITYKRTLKRPSINWLKICLCITVPIIMSVLIYVILSFYNISIIVCFAFIGLFLMIYVVVNLKKAVICIIRIYQHYAPETLRNKCRFEPSCSEYMILAIEKYGLLKGVKKGICRLRRCNIHNGGYDFP